MSKNVSTDGMVAAAAEINEVVGNLRQFISSVTNSCDLITSNCELLSNFNGKLACAPYEDHERSVQENCAYIVRERWSIDGQQDLISSCSSLVTELEGMSSILDCIYKLANGIELSVDDINMLKMDISSNLENAFDTLKSNIAYNQDQAKNGQFINADNILTEYWVDKPLVFEKQENGTYLIKQEDDSGNLVAMGFTTAVAYQMYIQGLTGKVSQDDNLVDMIPNDVDMIPNDTNSGYTKNDVVGQKTSIGEEISQATYGRGNTSTVSTDTELQENSSIAGQKILVGEEIGQATYNHLSDSREVQVAELLNQRYEREGVASSKFVGPMPKGTQLKKDGSIMSFENDGSTKVNDANGTLMYTAGVQHDGKVVTVFSEGTPEYDLGLRSIDSSDVFAAINDEKTIAHWADGTTSEINLTLRGS